MKKLQLNRSPFSEKDRKRLKKMRKTKDQFAIDFMKLMDDNPSVIRAQHALNLINLRPEYVINIFSRMDDVGWAFKKDDYLEIVEFYVKNPRNKMKLTSMIMDRAIPIDDLVFASLNVLTRVRSNLINRKMGFHYYNGTANSGMRNARTSGWFANADFLKGMLQYNHTKVGEWHENFNELKKKKKIPADLLKALNTYTNVSMHNPLLKSLRKGVEKLIDDGLKEEEQ